MKKLICILTVLALVVASMFVFASCNGNSGQLPSVGGNNNGGNNDGGNGGGTNIPGMGDISGGGTNIPGIGDITGGGAGGDVSGGDNSGSIGGGSASGGDNSGSVGGGSASGGDNSGSVGGGSSSSGTATSVPSGYSVYSNGSCSFAYPTEMQDMDYGTVVIFADATGNSINLLQMPLTNMYDNITLDMFYSDLVPQLEAQGMTASNANVYYDTSRGVRILIMSYDIDYQGIPMKQAQYIFSTSDNTYALTVTVANGDTELFTNVYNSITLE